MQVYFSPKILPLKMEEIKAVITSVEQLHQKLVAKITLIVTTA